MTAAFIEQNVRILGKPSALNFQSIILDHRIGKQVPAKLMEHRFRDLAIHFQFDALANARATHRGNSMVPDGIAHCDSLRIQDVLFGHHDDLGFHARRVEARSPGATPNIQMNQKSKTEDADLSGAEFINTNLSQAEFRDVSLAGARFVDVNIAGARFEDVALTGTVIRNANCSDVSIEDARYDGMRIDGILVTELLRVYRSQSPTSA